MWRQDMLRILLVGIIVGTVGVYLWRQTYPSRSSQLPRAPAVHLNPQEKSSPGQHGAANTWQAGVGEVPSFAADGVLSAQNPTLAREASSGVSEPGSARGVPEAPWVPEAPSAPDSSNPSRMVSENTSLDGSSQGAVGQEISPPNLLPMPEQSEEATAEIAALLPPSSPPDQPALQSESHAEPDVQASPELPWIAGPRQGSLVGAFPSELTPPSQPSAVVEAPQAQLSPPPAEPNLQVTGAHLRLLPPPRSEQTAGPSPPDNLMQEQSSQSGEEFSEVSSATPIASEPPEVPESQNPEETSLPSISDRTGQWGITFPQTGQTPPIANPGPSSSEPSKQELSPQEAVIPSGPAQPSGTPQPSGAPGKSSPGEQCLAGKRGGRLEQSAQQAHKTLFYENNFRYLEEAAGEETFLGDSLKRLQITPWATLDLGGEYRLRHHSERNHRGRGLTGQDDDFLLHRTRLYANLELGELARVYAEMNDALSTNETYLPRPMEENRTELENLFIDVPLLGFRSDGLVARLGRQELLYGTGRLVSPLDWANTRRTFEGYKLFWQGPLWTVDAFWTQPVYPNPQAFDTPDQSQQFMGLYLVRRLDQQAVLEGYYLRLVEEDGTPDFDFHTLGLRTQQEYNGWLGELEAAVQFGTYGAADHFAGMYTIGVGRRFPCLPGRPVFWMYYDWASGDPIQGNGFHHLFADSHQYLGAMDLFGRRNVEDWSFHLLVHPHQDWAVRLAWHIFHRQHPRDVPYGVDMRPLVALPGGSGDYGQELDIVLQWTIRPRAELQFGYSRFFAGEFFRTNPTPAPYQDDADFFYTQFSLRF